MRSFEDWLKELAEIFVTRYHYTEKQAKEYVTDQPEQWRDFFDDDFTPADAAHDDAMAGLT